GAMRAATPPPANPVTSLALLRYISVTEHVRHMPIAVVLIADQSHVQDVLSAFANSRLRFQTTQVRMLHRRDIKIALPKSSDADKGKSSKDKSSLQTQPTSPGGGGGKAQAAEDLPDPNLVEVVVYGIASLYERFKPKQTAAAAEATKPKAGG